MYTTQTGFVPRYGGSLTRDAVLEKKHAITVSKIQKYDKELTDFYTSLRNMMPADHRYTLTGNTLDIDTISADVASALGTTPKELKKYFLNNCVTKPFAEFMEGEAATSAADSTLKILAILVGIGVLAAASGYLTSAENTSVIDSGTQNYVKDVTTKKIDCTGYAEKRVVGGKEVNFDGQSMENDGLCINEIKNRKTGLEQKSVDRVQNLKSGEPKEAQKSISKYTSADSTLDAGVKYLDVLCSEDSQRASDRKQCSDKGESILSYSNCVQCSYLTKKLHMGRDGDALFLKATFDKDPDLDEALFYAELGIEDNLGSRPFRIEVKENSARVIVAEKYAQKDKINNQNRKETKEFPITVYNGGREIVIKVEGLYKPLIDRVRLIDQVNRANGTRFSTSLDARNIGSYKHIDDLLKQLQ